MGSNARSPPESGAKGRELDLWNRSAELCPELLGAHRSAIAPLPPDTGVFPFDHLSDTAPRSAEDFSSSTPGFPRAEASLLHNEKRKPRLAGGGGGGTRRVAAALNP